MGLGVDDDLNVPFLFVPRGDPEPTEWMARHPGWAKFPATMVPLGTRRDPEPDATVTRASATTADGWATPGSPAATGAGRAAAITEETWLDWVASGLWADVLPYVLPALIVFAPSDTEHDETELVREATEAADRKRAAMTPAAPLPASPGLEPPPLPPAAKPGEGGLRAAPPLPAAPGASVAPPVSPVLPGSPVAESGPTVFDQTRNDGLPAEARTDSARSRKNAVLADPAVVEALKWADWEAHHLINIAAVRAHAKLVAEAARAGWRTDDQGNVAPLPASSKAQAELEELGIDRPLHDSAHLGWNHSVDTGLDEIETELTQDGLIRGTPQYASAAREKLRTLQDKLRRELLELMRVTENGDTNDTEEET